jgi:hypothetical protein
MPLLSVLAFRRFPLRQIGLAYAFTSLLVYHGPKWILISLLPGWRPCKIWTFKKSIMFQLLRWGMGIQGLYVLNITAFCQ